jgi:RecA/RadA recombinase
LVLVMHLTTNIGVMFGEKMVPTSHGNAAIFMASTRTQLYATEELEDKNGNPIGTVLNFKTKKNRFTYKNKTAKVAFYFSGQRIGVDRWSGVVETCVAWSIFKSSAKKITPTAKISWEDYEFKAGEIEVFAKDWEAESGKSFIETINGLLVEATEGAEKNKDLQNYQDDDEAIEEAV